MIKRKQKQQHTTQSKRDSKCFFFGFESIEHLLLCVDSSVSSSPKVESSIKIAINLAERREEGVTWEIKMGHTRKTRNNNLLIKSFVLTIHELNRKCHPHESLTKGKSKGK